MPTNIATSSTTSNSSSSVEKIMFDAASGGDVTVSDAGVGGSVTNVTTLLQQSPAPDSCGTAFPSHKFQNISEHCLPADETIEKTDKASGLKCKEEEQDDDNDDEEEEEECFIGLCSRCVELRSKKNYCPLCQGCYEDDDYDARMMECGRCKEWIHAHCEGLSNEHYQILSCLPDSVEYVCRLCLGPNNGSYLSSIMAELKVGMELVLDNLMSSRCAKHLVKRDPYRMSAAIVSAGKGGSCGGWGLRPPSVASNATSVGSGKRVSSRGRVGSATSAGTGEDKDKSLGAKKSRGKGMNAQGSSRDKVRNADSSNLVEKVPLNLCLSAECAKEGHATGKCSISLENSSDQNINACCEQRAIAQHQNIASDIPEIQMTFNDKDFSLSDYNNKNDIIYQNDYPGSHLESVNSGVVLRSRKVDLEWSRGNNSVRESAVITAQQTGALRDEGVHKLKACSVKLMDICKDSDMPESVAVAAYSGDKSHELSSNKGSQELREENNVPPVAENVGHLDIGSESESGMEDIHADINKIVNSLVDPAEKNDVLQPKGVNNNSIYGYGNSSKETDSSNKLSDARLKVTSDQVTNKEAERADPKTKINKDIDDDLVSTEESSFCDTDSELESIIEDPDEPKDLMSIKEHLAEHKYDSVLQFHVDVCRVIEAGKFLSRGQTKNVTNAYAKHMKECFPWFDVQGVNIFDLVDKYHPFPMPHPDHNYAIAEPPSKLPCSPDFKNSPTKRSTLLSLKTPLAMVAFKPEPLAPSGVRKCVLCNVVGDGDARIEGRLLYLGQDEWLHVNCGLWSSEVYEEDDGGLQKVYEAASRGRMIKCNECLDRGATVGCCHRNCSVTYHFKCAINVGCQFLEDKRMYCSVHRNTVDGAEEMTDFQVSRCVYVDMCSQKKKWKKVFGNKVNITIGSLTIHSLGKILPELDSSEALIPIDFVCSRLYWSTVDPRKKVRYVCKTKRIVPAEGNENVPSKENPHLVIDHSKDRATVEKDKQLMQAWFRRLEEQKVAQASRETNIIPPHLCPLYRDILIRERKAAETLVPATTAPAAQPPQDECSAIAMKCLEDILDRVCKCVEEDNLFLEAELPGIVSSVDNELISMVLNDLDSCDSTLLQSSQDSGPTSPIDLDFLSNLAEENVPPTLNGDICTEQREYDDKKDCNRIEDLYQSNKLNLVSFKSSDEQNRADGCFLSSHQISFKETANEGIEKHVDSLPDINLCEQAPTPSDNPCRSQFVPGIVTHELDCSRKLEFKTDVQSFPYNASEVPIPLNRNNVNSLDVYLPGDRVHVSKLPSPTTSLVETSCGSVVVRWQQIFPSSQTETSLLECHKQQEEGYSALPSNGSVVLHTDESTPKNGNELFRSSNEASNEQSGGKKSGNELHAGNENESTIERVAKCFVNPDLAGQDVYAPVIDTATSDTASVSETAVCETSISPNTSRNTKARYSSLEAPLLSTTAKNAKGKKQVCRVLPMVSSRRSSAASETSSVMEMNDDLAGGDAFRSATHKKQPKKICMKRNYKTVIKKYPLRSSMRKNKKPYQTVQIEINETIEIPEEVESGNLVRKSVKRKWNTVVESGEEEVEAVDKEHVSSSRRPRTRGETGVAGFPRHSSKTRSVSAKATYQSQTDSASVSKKIVKFSDDNNDITVSIVNNNNLCSFSNSRSLHKYRQKTLLQVDGAAHVSSCSESSETDDQELTHSSTGQNSNGKSAYITANNIGDKSVAAAVLLPGRVLHAGACSSLNSLSAVSEGSLNSSTSTQATSVCMPVATTKISISNITPSHYSNPSDVVTKVLSSTASSVSELVAASNLDADVMRSADCTSFLNLNNCTSFLDPNSVAAAAAASQSALAMHIKEQSLAHSSPGDEGPYKCTKCRRLYRTRESFERHIESCTFEIDSSSTSDDDLEEQKLREGGCAAPADAVSLSDSSAQDRSVAPPGCVSTSNNAVSGEASLISANTALYPGLSKKEKILSVTTSTGNRLTSKKVITANALNFGMSEVKSNTSVFGDPSSFEASDEPPNKKLKMVSPTSRQVGVHRQVRTAIKRNDKKESGFMSPVQVTETSFDSSLASSEVFVPPAVSPHKFSCVVKKSGSQRRYTNVKLLRGARGYQVRRAGPVSIPGGVLAARPQAPLPLQYQQLAMRPPTQPISLQQCNVIGGVIDATSSQASHVVTSLHGSQAIQISIPAYASASANATAGVINLSSLPRSDDTNIRFARGPFLASSANVASAGQLITSTGYHPSFQIPASVAASVPLSVVSSGGLSGVPQGYTVQYVTNYTDAPQTGQTSGIVSGYQQNPVVLQQPILQQHRHHLVPQIAAHSVLQPNIVAQPVLQASGIMHCNQSLVQPQQVMIPQMVNNNITYAISAPKTLVINPAPLMTSMQVMPQLQQQQQISANPVSVSAQSFSPFGQPTVSSASELMVVHQQQSQQQQMNMQLKSEAPYQSDQRSRLLQQQTVQQQLQHFQQQQQHKHLTQPSQFIPAATIPSADGLAFSSCLSTGADYTTSNVNTDTNVSFLQQQQQRQQVVSGSRTVLSPSDRPQASVLPLTPPKSTFSHVLPNIVISGSAAGGHLVNGSPVSNSRHRIPFGLSNCHSSNASTVVRNVATVAPAIITGSVTTAVGTCREDLRARLSAATEEMRNTVAGDDLDDEDVDRGDGEEKPPRPTYSYRDAMNMSHSTAQRKKIRQEILMKEPMLKIRKDESTDPHETNSHSKLKAKVEELSENRPPYENNQIVTQSYKLVLKRDSSERCGFDVLPLEGINNELVDHEVKELRIKAKVSLGPKRKRTNLPPKDKDLFLAPVDVTHDGLVNEQVANTTPPSQNQTHLPDDPHLFDKPKSNSSGGSAEPYIVFELTSEDGFKVESRHMSEVWQTVFDAVTAARDCLRLAQQQGGNDGRPGMTLGNGMSGLHMLGLTHNAVQYLLEQLPGSNDCHKYSFQFHRRHREESSDDGSPSGCARAESFKCRSPYDLFSWLASQHRRLPETDVLTLQEEIQLCTRRATSLELPMAMRYRHLRDTAREAVGVFRSSIHGRGLFCKRDIDSGEMVIEYAGQMIRSSLCDIREKFYESKGIGCYMFRIDDDTVVDATMHGNAARFINHSCDPNCFSRVVDILGKKHIIIFALRRIIRGEELTYDYKFPIEDDKIPCSCGARRCRKTLN